MAPAQDTSSQELRRSKRLSAQSPPTSNNQVPVDVSLSQLSRPAQSKVKKSRASNKDKTKDKKIQLSKGQKRLSAFFGFKRSTKVSVTLSINDATTKVEVEQSVAPSFKSTTDEKIPEADDTGAHNAAEHLDDTKVEVTATTKKRKLSEDSEDEYTPEEPATKSRAVAKSFEGGDSGSIIETRTRARKSYQQYFKKEDTPATEDDVEMLVPAQAERLSTPEPEFEAEVSQVEMESEVQISHAVNESPTLGVSQDVNVHTSAHVTSATETVSVATTYEEEVNTPATKPKAKAIRAPPGGWDNKKAAWKWNWSPYPEHAAPSPDAAATVFEALRADLAKHHNVIVGPGEKFEGFVRPAHGSGEALDVDAVVRTILSQATSNKNALFVQDRLIDKYRYNVKGTMQKGTVPNYHLARLAPTKELEEALTPGGLHEKKSRQIKAFLNTVYHVNTVLHPEWDGVVCLNPINAPDFVPGPLSLEFLAEKSKMEIFDWLMDVEGVGIKTAQCVLEFNAGFDVCAVDTHIHYMSVALAWVPEECNSANKAAMHLDARLPDALKHDIHQAFWNHRQFCGPCKRTDGDEVKEADAQVCCVEEYIVERRRIRKAKLKEKVVESAEERKARIEARKAERALNPKSKPSKFPFDKFKSAEAAAEAGYELRVQTINDDFDQGSRNKSSIEIWVRVN
jgi:endonuclease III